MKNSIFPLFVVLFAIILFFSCKKVNDAPANSSVSNAMSVRINTTNWTAATFSSDTTGDDVSITGTGSDGSILKLMIPKPISAGSTYAIGNNGHATSVVYWSSTKTDTSVTGSIAVSSYADNIVKGTFYCNLNISNSEMTQGSFIAKLK